MLTPEDRAILDFERQWSAERGPKDMAVELGLGLTSSAFYERLRVLVFEAPALAYDPLTVKRVRSLIEHATERELAV